ncbi:hypothetical protein UlMin_044389 [Ulmus minor]
MAQTSSTENLTTETLKKKLFDSVMQQKWKEVAEIYEKNPSAHTLKINSSGETALHLAISDPEHNNKVNNVYELVRHIKKLEDRLEVLNLQTEKGNTLLHSAAATSQSGKVCKLLIDSVGGVKNKNALELVHNRCKKGETPLFKAVRYGRLGSFFFLHSIVANTVEDLSIFVRNDGQSILHEAIIMEHFDLAFYIIQLYKGLVNVVDQQGESPLHALARKATAFESGSSLHGFDKLIYKCLIHFCSYFNFIFLSTFLHYFFLIYIIFYILTEEIHHINEPRTRTGYVEKERTNIDIESAEKIIMILLCFLCLKDLRHLVIFIKRNLKMTKKQKQKQTALFKDDDIIVAKSYKNIATTSCRRPKAFGNIYKEKLKHTWAKQVLDELLESATMYGKNTTARPQENIRVVLSSSSVEKGESSEQKDTALLIAAKCGIVEMVKGIIKKIPVAIYVDEDINGNNVLLLAVEKRHKKSVIYRKENKKGNTALHLAATYDKEHQRPWPIPGVALQMVWEVKWYEQNMPSCKFLRTNKDNQTPWDIFSTTHKDLIKDGVEWLKSVATSCSVVAALIATIAFTSSTTVPGGTDSNTGKPMLRNNSTFNIFATASLIALWFSVTALIAFLAILTSRYHERDFGKNLPWKILMGLTSLLESIAAMLVTFCASRFLVFEEKIKYAVVPIYAVTFFPLCLFAVAQFSLYFDLVRAIFFSPFSYDICFPSFLKKLNKKVKKS